MSDYWKKKLDELNENNAKSSSRSSSKSYWKQKLDELEEEEKKKKAAKKDVAPVMETKKSDKKDDDGFDFFQKGAFSDGYQAGDVTKAILGTVGDLTMGVVKGGSKMVGGIVDAGAYGVAGIADAIGKDDFANRMRVKAQENVIDNAFENIDSQFDKYSLLGRTSDSIAEGLGQVGTIILTGGLAGAAGLGAVGATVATTGAMGVSSMGSGMSEAYAGGATDEEAATYGLIKGVVDAGSELIFGGLGKTVKALGLSKGLSSLDDVFAKKLGDMIANQTAKNFVEFGVKASAEGVEEVLAGLGTAVGKKLTYMDDKELNQLVKDENLLEQFVVGAVTSGIAQSGIVPGMKGGSLREANETGRDFISGLTENEQKVVDKEYENRLAEESKERELSKKDKEKIYNEVLNDLDEGGISIDTIEEVLGGERYSNYKSVAEHQDAIKEEHDTLNRMRKGDMTGEQEDRLAELKAQLKTFEETNERDTLKNQLSEEVFGLAKDSKLVESYNERGRRSQAFEADLTQYDTKQQEVIKKAVDSGILNDTRRTHKFVDMVSKISADKGVLFDFANNEKLKESGFAIEGKTVNGFVTKDGVTLNIDSAKSLNTVVGHEITHVLEGTELYTELQSIMKSYAETKGEYESRRTELAELYKDIKDADIDAELTADLVGDYLFTDENFINNLSTNHRNVFQKIYDEVKYLCKVATAGSKEARQLEKVKRAFEKAYKEGGKKQSDTTSETRFSLSKSVEETKDLMALHNLTEQKLLKSLKLGGLPMPSVAIAKAQDGHSEFGEISLILPRDAIDPEYSRKNKLYSGDAWTPTYPRVEYKVDDKVRKNISNKIASLVPETIRDGLGGLHLDADNMNDTLNRYGGDMVEAFGRDDVMKYAYLVDNGSDISLPMKEANLAYYGRVSNDAIRYFSGKLVNGLQTVELYQNMGAQAMMQDEALKEAVADAQNWDVLRTFEPGSAEYLEYERNPVFRADEVSFSDIDDFLSGCRKLFKYGVQKTVDKQAARELIRGKVNQTEYEAWLNELFTGIVEKEGLRNNKDYFTPSGNRRSFEALHYEHNLENVIKAMRESGEKGIGFGGGSIFGAATTEFSSVDEMKQSRDRLQKMSDEEYQAMRDEFTNRFFGIASSLPKDKSSFMATDDAANTLVEAVTKYKTRSGIANYLKRELNGWATYSDAAVDDLIELVRDIRSMPTGYFEAKPQRAVGFDEVGVFIIPNNADAKLKQELLNRGYSIAEYDPNVEGDRRRVTNGFEEYKFSLSNVGESGKSYGNYNVYGKDIALNATPNTENVLPNTENVLESEVPAPVSEEVSPVSEVESQVPVAESELFPDDMAPMPEDTERLDSLTDEDAPPVREAPYQSDKVEAADPFYDRDIGEVGNRKVKAYMYENPEVKPFFQQEAQGMLYDLRNSIKGEKWYNDEVYYETGGERGWGGTTRHTTDDIAYLLDECGYTYAQIEKGLNAIIEDNGAENNAVSKRIEFMLNDRLMYGYKDVDGRPYEPNQDYINLITEKQINEYSKEAFDAFMENADAYAPEEDIAPVKQAPVKEKYEAIRPKREKQPKLIRVDTAESTPGQKQRKWVETSTESEAVDRKVLPDDLDPDKINYQPIPNKVTLGKANSRLDSMGYDSAIAYFNSQFANKSVSLEDVALGERLIQEAIKRGDTKTAGELIQNVSILGTELGQKVQALSIIKRLTPEGQLKMLQKTVERGKTKGDKAFEGVEFTQEMIDKILSAYNPDGSYDQMVLNEMVEDVKKDIADQMKVTKLDKVNAWRYLSMLGNPKTHIRNLVSNVAMRGTMDVKNAVARTIESIAPVENRTKTWKAASEEVKSYARKTALEMKDIISGESRYNEAASIKDKRRIFQNKILNAVYEFNSDMLGKEDWWFSKAAYTSSLSEFLTANGIRTAQDIKTHPEVVEKARQYALEQSQIATFRQYSWLANKINEIEHRNTATNVAVGAIVPFKKTPINIAKTGLNYSPLGFAKTLTYDMSQVKNGKMEASEMIDHLAQNVTGSSLALVGYMLAQSGLLNGAGEDDKEGEYDYQLGEQAYSVNIGGATFSLSWLSPVAMPLFVGVNAYEQLVEGKEWNGDVVVETLAQTLDPLSEMSFISSLDSVLSSYDSGIQKFAGIGETMAQNYITQFAPTLMSQVATVMDDTKRSTKVSGDSDFKFVEQTINKLKYKIPFLRETLEPTTDIWGNEVKQTENVFARAFETFIAPYAKREDIASEIDEEIKGLYSETGDTGLIPSIPYNYVSYDGEKYKMSAKDFTEFKQNYGQTAYDLIEDLFATDTYKAADAETKADYVNKVYDYARDEARKEYFAKFGVEFTNATEDGKEYYRPNAIKGAIENDVTPEEYTFSTKYPEKYKFLTDNGVSYSEYESGSDDFKDAYTWAYNNPDKFTLSKAVAGNVVEYRQYTGELYDIKADKDASGKSINGSRKEKVADYINNLDLDYGARIILFKSEYNADDTYNYDIIDYLNSREDISYKEMETILKELGFEVDSKGNISW